MCRCLQSGRDSCGFLWGRSFHAVCCGFFFWGASGFGLSTHTFCVGRAAWGGCWFLILGFVMVVAGFYGVVGLPFVLAFGLVFVVCLLGFVLLVVFFLSVVRLRLLRGPGLACLVLVFLVPCFLPFWFCFVGSGTMVQPFLKFEGYIILSLPHVIFIISMVFRITID